MANTITGKIHKITPVTEIKGKSGKSFFKRTLVLDARRYDPNTGEPKYDNYPSFEFSGDMMKELDKYAEGNYVTVSYDINGREVRDEATGETRYFNSIRGYKVEPYGKGHTAAEQAAAQHMQTVFPEPEKPLTGKADPSMPPPRFENEEKEPNDLPF